MYLELRPVVAQMYKYMIVNATGSGFNPDSRNNETLI